jgi:hypothetical protein
MNSNNPAMMYTVEELLMSEEEADSYLLHTTTEAQMAYEMEDGQVSVFVNDKGDNPKRPDYTGRCMVDGKELQISLWKSTSQSGLDYLSGKINPPYNGGGGSSSRSSVSADDIPF